MPALLARRWIIVGDVQQLAPFVDEGGFTTNLNGLLEAPEQEAVTFCKKFEGLWPKIAASSQGHGLLHRCNEAAIPYILKELQARLTAITPPAVGIVLPRKPARQEPGCLNLWADLLIAAETAGTRAACSRRANLS